MFWGLSPALDFIADLKKVTEVDGSSDLNILLIGSIDARHILKTMSLLKRHATQLKVNFYVMETAVELVVRQILLIMIALEPKEKLGLIEKPRLWMEIYGNTLVRIPTAKYVIHKMGQIRSLISDQAFLKKRLPLLDLSLLRYLDLDCLEETARYFQRNSGYMISKIWDLKLRELLDELYDDRFGIFDWDYTQKLARIPGGHRVCSSEYMFWRSSGVAFTWLETEYSVGNPTLAVGICSSGDTLYSFGYLGDMESGPYFAFGTDSEEKQMLERRSDYPVRRATDITERNLQRMFHELEHGSPPSDLYSASIDMGLVLMKPVTIDIDKEVTLEFEPDRAQEDYSSIPVPNCKVSFLPSNAMEVFPKKAKYKEFFDVVYVAQNFFKFLNTDLMSMAKPNGCLVIETRKFVIALDKDIGAFGKEVRNKLKEIGWEEITKYHFKRDDHVVCRKRQGPPEKNISESEGEDEEIKGTHKESDGEETKPNTKETEKRFDEEYSKVSDVERKEVFDLEQGKEIEVNYILESKETSISNTDSASGEGKQISLKPNDVTIEGKDKEEVQMCSMENVTGNGSASKTNDEGDDIANCISQIAGSKASGSNRTVDGETPSKNTQLTKDYTRKNVSDSDIDSLLKDFQACTIRESTPTGRSLKRSN